MLTSKPSTYSSYQNSSFNGSSDDSGFYSPGVRFHEEKVGTPDRLAMEEKDSLSPLQKIERKPLKYYRKQFEKPVVKHLINHWKEKEDNINRNDKKKKDSNTNQPNTYQTTFVRVWPSDHSDIRLL